MSHVKLRVSRPIFSASFFSSTNSVPFFIFFSFFPFLHLNLKQTRLLSSPATTSCNDADSLVIALLLDISNADCSSSSRGVTTDRCSIFFSIRSINGGDFLRRWRSRWWSDDGSEMEAVVRDGKSDRPALKVCDPFISEDTPATRYPARGVDSFWGRVKQERKCNLYLNVNG